jgi:DNA-binding PucR family transcriptional regulator
VGVAERRAAARSRLGGSGPGPGVAAEHNAASAAAALGVHQQTIANRLRAAEERIGHPVAARRIELETAMRLRASLDL